MQKIITDNSGERLIMKWDGTRFALVKEWQEKFEGETNVTILNQREMDDIFEFVREVKGETKESR